MRSRLFKIKRRASKKRGGSSNLGFKYTRKPERVKWAETIYQYGMQIMTIIPKFDWSGYKFEGESEIEISMPENDSTNYIQNRKSLSEIKKSLLTTILSDKPYSVVGGVACELLWNKYSKGPNLHNDVDPTGDIDIKIFLPKLIEIDGSNKFEDSTQLKLINNINNTLSYTKQGDHLSSWLFDQVVLQVKLIEPEIVNELFTIPELENTKETSIADKNTKVGKFLVTRILEPTMIKIQLTIKIGAIADHFMEFVIVDEEMKGVRPSVNGIIVENPQTLMFAQMKALFSRSQPNWIGRVSVHKVLNHCGRILYLAKLLSYLKFTIGTGLREAEIGQYYHILNSVPHIGYYCEYLPEKFLKAALLYQTGTSVNAFKKTPAFLQIPTKRYLKIMTAWL